MLHRVQNMLRRGPGYIAGRIYAKAFRPTARCFDAQHFTGKGIEIGGPSKMFERRELLPIYPICESLDGCNFGPTTVWEGTISEGPHYRFGGRIGHQFISEASRLLASDGTYDFLISCHMLEHSANPIGALMEWRRVIKRGGHLLLVLPLGKWTFDHNRPVTTIRHLVDDYERGMGEDDRTHIEESIALHDLSESPEYASREELRAYFSDNLTHRRVHHHVFTEAVAVQMVRYSGFDVLASEESEPQSVIVFARKH